MNHKSYINLIDEAESDMLANGKTSLDDRVYMLSGIYYATTWCHEYLVMHIGFRRKMFEAKPSSTPPTIAAARYFFGTDYGAASNLYGDVFV